jgi:hypothetical protein
MSKQNASKELLVQESARFIRLENSHCIALQLSPNVNCTSQQALSFAIRTVKAAGDSGTRVPQAVIQLCYGETFIWNFLLLYMRQSDVAQGIPLPQVSRLEIRCPHKRVEPHTPCTCVANEDASVAGGIAVKEQLISLLEGRDDTEEDTAPIDEYVVPFFSKAATPSAAAAAAPLSASATAAGANLPAKRKRTKSNAAASTSAAAATALHADATPLPYGFPASLRPSGALGGGAAAASGFADSNADVDARAVAGMNGFEAYAASRMTDGSSNNHSGAAAAAASASSSSSGFNNKRVKGPNGQHRG